MSAFFKGGLRALQNTKNGVHARIPVYPLHYNYACINQVRHIFCGRLHNNILLSLKEVELQCWMSEGERNKRNQIQGRWHIIRCTHVYAYKVEKLPRHG